MNIEQIDREACLYTFRGKNIAYRGQRNMRNLARHVGVRSDGSRLEVFTRIVSYLDESGAPPEIYEPEDIKVTPEPVERQNSSIDLFKTQQEPAKRKRPAKKIVRKRRRGAKFLEEIIPERKKATFL